MQDQLHSAGLAAADLSAVNAILCDTEQAAVKEVGAPREPSLQRLLPVINRCFGHHTVGGIVKALGAEQAERPWCEEALQQLQRWVGGWGGCSVGLGQSDVLWLLGLLNVPAGA